MKNNIRIYVKKKLPTDFILLDKKITHYLKNVMRLNIGDKINIFNEIDGEWTALIEDLGKKNSKVIVEKKIGFKKKPCDIWIFFAPVKNARIDFISQKITELGSQLIWPVITERTQNKSIKESRILSNAIEAAEQCGSTFVPKVNKIEKLDKIIEKWDEIGQNRTLIFCDEFSKVKPLEKLRELKKTNQNDKWALLIGPEGGFSDLEREKINKISNLCEISLGPRVLRSDTAIISALSIFHSILGDWV